MNKRNYIFALSLIVFTITSCATTSTAPTIDEIVAEGGTIVDFEDLIGDSGVTFVGSSNAWYNYLGPEGRKVVKITESGAIKELAWRVNEDGQFCQEMFATEEELCDSHVVIKDSDGNYNTYSESDNEPGYPFIPVTGNPEGF